MGLGDLPTEGTNRTLSIESPQSNNKGRWAIPAVIVLVVVMLVTIIGLSVGLTRNNSNSNNVNDQIGGGGGGGGGNSAPVPSPTESPISISSVENWIASQGYSSKSSLESSGSPQSRAASFMADEGMEVPTENSSPESYQWMERYVVTVFYFAMNGPNWKNQYNFLQKGRPTCGWFFFVNVAGLGIVPIGASCDEIVQKVDALQFSKCEPPPHVGCGVANFRENLHPYSL